MPRVFIDDNTVVYEAPAPGYYAHEWWWVMVHVGFAPLGWPW
jgi:hypothetical protein